MEYIQRQGHVLGSMIVLLSLLAEKLFSLFGTVPFIGGLFEFAANWELQVLVFGIMLIVFTAWMKHKWVLYVGIFLILLITVFEWAFAWV